MNSLYERLQSPDDWPAALALIAEQFGSHTAQVLFHPDPSAAPLLNIASTVTDPARAEEYIRDYVPLDPRWPHFVRNTGRAVRCVDIVPIEVMEKSPLIPFLDHPEVNARWCLVTPFLLDGNKFGFITALRRRQSGIWDDGEVDSFQALAPHVIRIVELQRRLGELSERVAMTEAALHAIDSALVLTDGAGRIRFVNSAADAIFRGPDISSKNGRLVCGSPSDTAALLKVIYETATSVTGGIAPQNTYLVRRPDNQSPFVVIALPLPRNHAAAELTSIMRRTSRVAVFILDPSARVQIPFNLLRQLGFTPAEARLAIDLASGTSLTRAAESHTLSRETVRTHLARILRKTGTNSQGELIAFLNRCFRVNIRSG